MNNTRCDSIASSVLELIGNTPMVRLNSVTEGLASEVLAKLEYMNPSGSIKDRIARWMVEAAENEGLLKPGYRIVEASTGNTAIALSLVAAVKGYDITIFMPKRVASAERTSMIESYGAQVTLIDTDPASCGLDASVHGASIEVVPRMRCRSMEASCSEIWWAKQFKNPNNAIAHRETTGKEILRQVGGHVDVFVASVGTGGTLMGVAQALTESIPGVMIIAAEPAGAPHLLGSRDDIPIIEGITDGLLLDILDSGLVDEVIPVTNDDAVAMADQLAQREGLFCGVSSGASVFAALQIACELPAGKRIVTVLPDSRDRYLTEPRYVT